MSLELSGILDDADDWRGITSPRERRRRQNRLHQRKYRKKRHLDRLGLESTSIPGNENRDAIVSLARAAVPPTATGPGAVQYMPIFHILYCHGVRAQALEFMQKAALDWNMHLPIPRDLPALSRLNSFDALARNALILRIPRNLLEADEGDSPFFQPNLRQITQLPYEVPAHLYPTALQRKVKHHPWLDLFPFPKMRDNILVGLQAGVLDEDQLANEFVCDFLDLTGTTTASLMIWGDSWDMFGWEFCPTFFRKWAFLLKDCQEVLQATNSWRAKRNVKQLEYVLD